MTFAWIACGLLAAQPEVEGDGVRVLVGSLLSPLLTPPLAMLLGVDGLQLSRVFRDTI